MQSRTADLRGLAAKSALHSMLHLVLCLPAARLASTDLCAPDRGTRETTSHEQQEHGRAVQPQRSGRPSAQQLCADRDEVTPGLRQRPPSTHQRYITSSKPVPDPVCTFCIREASTVQAMLVLVITESMTQPKIQNPQQHCMHIHGTWTAPDEGARLRLFSRCLSQ